MIRTLTGIGLAALLVTFHPGATAARQPGEGIKVHGHWVIDVRNPDGTLVQHREFENALIDAGAVHLASVFMRTVRPGPLLIELGSSVSGQSICLRDEQQTYCAVFPEGTTIQPQYGGMSFATLVQSLEGDRAISLSGTATAQRSGSVGWVGTFMRVCGAADSLADCGTFRGWGQEFYTGLTHASIAPVPIAAGQIIQVKVTLSFS